MTGLYEGSLAITSLGLFRMWKAVSNGRSLRSNPPSPLNERLPLFEALKSGNGISLLSANHTLPIAMVRCRTWELTGKILGRLEIVLFPGFPGSVPQGGTHGFGIRRVPLRGTLPGQFLANYCGLFPASSFCFSNRLSSDLLFLFSLSCAFNCWKISKWCRAWSGCWSRV